MENNYAWLSDQQVLDLMEAVGYFADVVCQWGGSDAPSPEKADRFEDLAAELHEEATRRQLIDPGT